MSQRSGYSRRKVLAGIVGAAVAARAASVFGQSRVSSNGNAPSAGTSLDGRIALVTGSTDGLGREVALRLGALGATVLVHGRNRERGSEVVAAIEAAGGRAAFHGADLASLDEVARLADEISSQHDHLHLLINNAGIWTDGSDERRESADGHELVFAINYLAPFALTHRLLPLLEAGAPARIVNVASIAQQPIDFDDPMLTRGFSASRAYAQSKLALVMLTMDLAEQLADTGVTANALHPATLMDTTMVERAGARPMSTVDDGADAVMQLAVPPALEGRSGLYFNQMNEARANAQAYDAAARRRLRDLSTELTGVGG